MVDIVQYVFNLWVLLFSSVSPALPFSHIKTIWVHECVKRALECFDIGVNAPVVCNSEFCSTFIWHYEYAAAELLFIETRFYLSGFDVTKNATKSDYLHIWILQKG